MDNRKTEKKELNLEELSRAVGGAGGGISYTVMALKEKHETDRGTIRCLRSGMCPNYNKQAHTKVLGKISDTEFTCDCRGIRWVIQ
ncbi:MAG: hypothetical protein IKE15_09045 [Clostridia bacterium]|nr:hypothetical protein [Clostridia bacterium]